MRLDIPLVLKNFRNSLLNADSDRLLVNLMLWLWCLAVPIAWVQQAYFGNAINAALSFAAADGWCDPSTQGIGVHCFGDYAFPMRLIESGSVWNNTYGIPHSYPPFGMLPFALASSLGALSGSLALPTVVFISLCALGAASPALFIMWRRTQWPAALMLFLFGVGSAPLLIAVDRGNVIALCVPLLLGFAVAGLRGNYIAAACCIALVAAVKPQFILLALLFVALRLWRPLLVSGLGFLALSALGLLVWPGDRLQNLREWYANVSEFESYQDASIPSPTNVSAARAVVSTIERVGLLNPGIDNFTRSLGELLTSNSRWIGLTLLVAALVTLWFRGRQMPIFYVLVVCLAMPTLYPALAFAYNLVFVLPLAALVMVNHGSDHARPWLRLPILLAMACTCVPLIVPYGTGPDSLLTDNAGLLWLLVIVLTLVHAWRNGWKSRPIPTSPSPKPYA